MVFTKLSAHDKDAFFALLDEYFQSRPELFGQDGQGGSAVAGLAGTGVTVSPAAVASVAQHAAFAAGAIGGGGGASNKWAVAPPAAAGGGGAHAHDAVASLGRVAAASLAFSGGGGSGGGLGAKPAVDAPAPLPRRPVSNAPAAAPADQVGVPGAEVDKLVTKKGSILPSFGRKQPPPPIVAIPPAFATPKSTFGPPPVRRTTSETAGAGVGAGRGASGEGATVRRQVPPAPAARPTEEAAEGEWAEALYDYASEDPADLPIEAGTRVFVTARSSEDWWTGQVEGQGKEGLFPASYVKLL